MPQPETPDFPFSNPVFQGLLRMVQAFSDRRENLGWVEDGEIRKPAI
ncbi:hypothetical protein K9N68_34585 (plasmid) [Kovacikia minuta CCNUW1]|nr:hypothetical protein [Kovacikia minuta]UBF30339.1 hypothetical protein K9N68_34585 [Kovacikia minuta CCNUW1]